MTTDILDALRSDESEYEARRKRNRLTFPQAASTMDKLAAFNPKLVWAEEGGHTIGVMPDWAKERRG